jgi:acetyl esterase
MRPNRTVPPRGTSNRRFAYERARDTVQPCEKRRAGQAVIGDELYLVNLEPVTQHFVDNLAALGAFPLSGRSAASVRTALADLQSAPIGKPNASIEDMTFPVGPKGAVYVRIARPKHTTEIIPAIMFFHGGGWIAGGVDTHDRLIREIAVAVHAAVVFVAFGRAPEIQFPISLEEAYAATAYVANNADSLNLDGTRLAVVGDGAGGNMAAAVAMMSKQRRGPRIAFQALFYPVTAANFESASYRHWRDGPWLSKKDMEWFWDAYLPSPGDRANAVATPLSATIDELRGLPDALLITAEVDVLRDEGEAYARKLSEANVRTTCTRYIGTIHDFVMLNALADTPAARCAVGQAVCALRSALA